MSDVLLEICPDCGIELPAIDGPTHRYLGGSASCWDRFSRLLNGGDPPLAPAPTNGLLIDAYAAQHHGVPSPQAINSVAVHLLALYGVLEKGVPVGRAVWLRQRFLVTGKKGKHERFHWLTPPAGNKSQTILDMISAPTPQERTEHVARYVNTIWQVWAPDHRSTLEAWYAEYLD